MNLRFSMVLVLFLSASLTLADEADPRRPAAIHTQDVPVVSAEVVAKLSQYQNTRAAAFRGWAPDGNGLLISTRFGNAAQLHRVSQPGGRREQITFFDEPVVGRFIPGASDRALLLSVDSGGNENAQLWLSDPQRFQTRLLSDGKSRNLVGAWRADGSAVIVANKTDLAAEIARLVAEIAEAAPGVPLHAISARADLGVSGLEPYLADNRTAALIGSSGVGKSTLINRLLGRDAQATGEVRGHDSRGRHTTTHRQLFLRPAGGAIIDTPGMRGLEVWQPTEAAGPDFADVEALAAGCKFRDCRHQTEPGCAVRAAVAKGQLEASRLAAYPRSRRA